MDYRHVVHALLRKPGAFAQYRYREELFPSAVFRQAYDQLCAGRSQRHADLEYVLHPAFGGDHVADSVTGEDAQVLYDVSSSYYEGRTCPLMQFGYSRDGKRGRPSVVYGVLADRRGRPVAVQAYPGNTGDPTSVPDRIASLRSRFGLQRLVLVGDRGMLTDTQVEHLRQYPGLGWISALRHDDIRQLAAERSVQMSLFDHRNLAEIRSPLYPDERLVVCSNPALDGRRRHKREDLLAATEELFERIQREVRRRTKKPLRATEIATKVGRAQQRFKVGKHFRTVIEDGRFEFSRNAVSIEREAALDGLYVIRTSQADLTAEDVVRSYKQLTRVERAFRCLKDRGFDGATDPPPRRGPRAGAHLPVPAGLLRGMAPAAGAGAAAVPGRGTGSLAGAPRSGGAGQADAGGASEEEPPGDVRRPGAAQFLDADAGAGDVLSPSMPAARRPAGAHSGASDRADALAGTGAGTRPGVASRRPVQLLTNQCDMTELRPIPIGELRPRCATGCDRR